MKNCPVLLLLAACALVAASAPTFAQTGIPALDNAIKKLERLAPSAPAQGPAAEAPTKQPTQQAPEQPTATAPESRAKSDLDLVGVRLGMTLAEAQAALKNRNPNYEIEVLNVEFPAPGAMKFISGLHAQHNRKLVGGGSIPLGGGRVHVIPGSIMSGEAVQVVVSGPPTSPTVLGIARHETFQGEEPNADQFVAALTQKFGTPDVADASTLFWFPDLPKPLQTGNSVRCSPTLSQMGIQTDVFVHMLRAPLWPPGHPQPNYLSVNHPALAGRNLDWSKPLSSCGPVVRVQLIRTGPQGRLLSWYNMYLFDFASTYKNMADLRQHVREAKADKDKEVIDQSEKQKKPTF